MGCNSSKPDVVASAGKPNGDHQQTLLTSPLPTEGEAGIKAIEAECCTTKNDACSLPIASVRGLKILILSNGSRGDVQPFAALGYGLNKNGADVTMLANPDHRKFVEELGLKFIDNGVPYSEWFTSDPCVKAMSANDILTFLDGWNKYLEPLAADHQEKVYKGIATSKPDLVLCSTNHWTDRLWISIVFEVPSVILNLSNWGIPFKPAFGLPVLPLGLNTLMWKMAAKVVADGARKLRGPTLERLSGRSMEELLETTDEMLSMHGCDNSWSFAPYVIAQDLNVIPMHPQDPGYTFFHYPGFLTVPADCCVGEAFGGSQATTLDNFIAKSPTPPVYIGWGSVSCVSPEYMTCMAVRALKIAGCRGIILGGWAELQEKHLEGQADADELKAFARTEILFMKTAAHETLFPRCSCLVHHGGIGTTISGLRSGTPSIITPIFYDQFDSADIIEKSGTGIQSKALIKVSPEELASHIQKCVSCPEMQKKAKETREMLRNRDSIQETVDLLAKFYYEEGSTGNFQRHIDMIAAQKKRNASRFSLFGACTSDARA